MNSFNLGDKVYLRDRSLGNPLNIGGKIVGLLSNEHYKVLMQNGVNEGNIVEYKYWDLFLIDNKEKML